MCAAFRQEPQRWGNGMQGGADRKPAHGSAEMGGGHKDMRAVVLCCSTNIRFEVLDHNRLISYSANREVNEPATHPDN